MLYPLLRKFTDARSLLSELIPIVGSGAGGSPALVWVKGKHSLEDRTGAVTKFSL